MLWWIHIPLFSVTNLLQKYLLTWDFHHCMLEFMLWLSSYHFHTTCVQWMIFISWRDYAGTYEQYSTNINTTVTNDSIFYSYSTTRSTWRSKKKVMIHGVMRSDGHGVPKCVFQKEATAKADKEKARGTLKVALLKGDYKVQGLLEPSYYYSKPFYMMTNEIDKFQWIKKKERCSEKIYKEHRRPLLMASMWLACTTTTWIMLMFQISWGGTNVSTIGCAKGNGGGLCFSGVFKFLSLTHLLFTKIIWYCTYISQLATTTFTRQWH